VPWVVFYVAIAVLGLVVLALVTLRLWGQVRQFAREIGSSAEKIASLTDELSKATPPAR
jgi:hypothetical protein